MMTTLFQHRLEKMNACVLARDWVGNKTARQAWEECVRYDWMLWLLYRAAPDDGYKAAYKAIKAVYSANTAGAYRAKVDAYVADADSDRRALCDIIRSHVAFEVLREAIEGV